MVSASVWAASGQTAVYHDQRHGALQVFRKVGCQAISHRPVWPFVSSRSFNALHARLR